MTIQYISGRILTIYDPGRSADIPGFREDLDRLCLVGVGDKDDRACAAHTALCIDILFPDGIGGTVAQRLVTEGYVFFAAEEDPETEGKEH